jgi:hypothetical protein
LVFLGIEKEAHGNHSCIIQADGDASGFLASLDCNGQQHRKDNNDADYGQKLHQSESLLCCDLACSLSLFDNLPSCFSRPKRIG